jgi:outer membrane protein, multidrug efflux system
MHSNFPMTRTSLAIVALLTLAGCVAPSMPAAIAPEPVPGSYASAAPTQNGTDTSAAANVAWRTFFSDTGLVALIDTAVRSNPERLSVLQDVEMARYAVQAIRGRLAPQVSAAVGIGLDKSGRFTSEGAGNASTNITDGQRVPEPLPNLQLGFVAGWEVDVRGKIRSQKGAALARYLATVEGSRFVTTALVAEIANGYYELSALDAKLAIVQQTITLQRDALRVVQVQRDAAQVSELAVQQFRGLLLNAQALEFEIVQQIRESENNMNALLGRFPQPVTRGALMTQTAPQAITEGVPAQLLQNRPDIAQAELLLMASRFDVKAARAEFFPQLNLTGAFGVRAFKPSLLFSTGESLTYGLAADALAPLINRRTIKAEFAMASAAQQQALFNYRRTILGGVSEVSTLISALDNLEREYGFKAQQADALDRSTGIATLLFTSARANYLEVLTAQREALDVKLELVETRLRQRQALTNLYRALGGGWK